MHNPDAPRLLPSSHKGTPLKTSTCSGIHAPPSSLAKLPSHPELPLFTAALLKYHKFTFCSSLLCSKPPDLLVCEDCSVVPISICEDFCNSNRKISHRTRQTKYSHAVRTQSKLCACMIQVPRREGANRLRNGTSWSSPITQEQLNGLLQDGCKSIFHQFKCRRHAQTKSSMHHPAFWQAGHHKYLGHHHHWPPRRHLPFFPHPKHAKNQWFYITRSQLYKLLLGTPWSRRGSAQATSHHISYY